MGLANDPCWASALPEELRFVLLARDPDAPGVVRDWVRRRLARMLETSLSNTQAMNGDGMRRMLVGWALMPSLKADAEWMIEALDCADAMEAQRADVRAALRKAPA